MTEPRNSTGNNPDPASGVDSGSADQDSVDQDSAQPDRVDPDSVDPDRVATRAELLPEELAVGSDDPEAQAAAILLESEERTADPNAGI